MTRTRVRSLTFEAVDLAEPQRPKYQRLYDEYVTAMIHLYADGTEITHTNKLPASFELSDTVLAFYEGITSLVETGHDEGEYFCCTCGTRGCAYIRWSMTLDGDDVLVDMETLGRDPIGDHEYVVSLDALVLAVVDLCETLLAFMDERDIEELSKGSREAFERRRDELLALLD